MIKVLSARVFHFWSAEDLSCLCVCFGGFKQKCKDFFMALLSSHNLCARVCVHLCACVCVCVCKAIKCFHMAQTSVKLLNISHIRSTS